MSELTTDLARFLASLHAVCASGGPTPGPDNSYRGGMLSVYDQPFRSAVTALDTRSDVMLLLRAWDIALTSSWRRAPVWVHGDIALGNLLLIDGKLSAVIALVSSPSATRPATSR